MLSAESEHPIDPSEPSVLDQSRETLATLRAQRIELQQRYSALQSTNHALEQRMAEVVAALQVSDRALQASTERLSHASADLAHALRLKSEFLAMMSHELRTPLHVIISLDEALVEQIYGPLTDRQRQAMQTITQSARQLLSILSSILDLARVMAGGELLELRPVDVGLICRAALQQAQAAAEAKPLRLHVTLAADVPRLLSDEHRLAQIIANLLDNAVKFTPAGGEVGLDLQVDAQQEAVQIDVWDTGIGIAPADYDQLFQPFLQLDGRLARAYGGIGLGLTLVRRLVELHGGSLSLATTPGAGSRFSVRLPTAGWDAAAPLADHPLLADRRARPPRILFADSHEPTLARYRELLGQQGCEVVIVRAAAEVPAQIAQAQPDLAVIDLQLTGKDGVALITQLRSDPAVAALPIIALAGLALPGDRARCLAGGASAYLLRPVSMRTLADTIAGLIATGDRQGAELHREYGV